MNNLRIKASKKQKKRKGNQYTAAKIVVSVIKNILDEILASGNEKTA